MSSMFSRLLRPRMSSSCLAAGILAVCVALGAGEGGYVSGKHWQDPKAVHPGEGTAAPSDAIVLFDGKDLSQWEGGKWVVKDGYAVTTGSNIHTKRAFGNCQLHVEFFEPEGVTGEGQARGNSGVFMMGLYEIQVLDSYEHKTYFDGQCAAIYKQRPPLVNACRKPGEWQTYDIVFAAPVFSKEGKLKSPAYVTILQNGVLVQNHFALLGDTRWERAPQYKPHPAKLPLELQYHMNSVRYRNIWIREL